jgi:hypothetical protein
MISSILRMCIQPFDYIYLCVYNQSAIYACVDIAAWLYPHMCT